MGIRQKTVCRLTITGTYTRHVLFRLVFMTFYNIIIKYIIHCVFVISAAAENSQFPSHTAGRLLQSLLLLLPLYYHNNNNNSNTHHAAVIVCFP